MRRFNWTRLSKGRKAVVLFLMLLLVVAYAAAFVYVFGPRETSSSGEGLSLVPILALVFLIVVDFTLLSFFTTYNN